MTYFAEIDPNSPANIAADAHAAEFTAEFPDWEASASDPERFVSEADYRDAIQRDVDTLAADIAAFHR